MVLSIEEMAAFCKRKGFIYHTSEIYGGISGFFDFGPLGVELKNRIKSEWWKSFVHDREDIVGMDGAVVTHPKVWQASGHIDCFADIVLSCSNKKCREKVRADTFLEQQLKKSYDGISAKEVNQLVKTHTLLCPKCQSPFQEAKDFNLMFETYIGPEREKSNTNTVFLRPETAQLIFTNFRLVMENSRQKLPFGIAQTGKAFRNEISPRDFLFRSREFEQMEIEFFVNPDKVDDCPYLDELKKLRAAVLTKAAQENNEKPKQMSFLELAKLTTQWHAYWIGLQYKWFIDLGIDQKNLRLRQHKKTELAHYAKACFDIEYNFPFGWKEIHGSADRTQYDITQHMKVSGKDLTVYDEESKQKIVPYVAAEPSQGVDRAFLAFMFDAYDDDKQRGNIVLKLHPKLAPLQIGFFPLINKIKNEAREVFELLKKDFRCFFDSSGSIGRRYARADEQGVPYCITFDFDSLTDKSVTIRNRDDTKQVRVKIEDIQSTLQKLLAQELAFEKAGYVLSS